MPRFKGRCQVWFKEGHSANQCWHRFDEDYVPDERHVAAANAATMSYNVDTNWYTDTGSTDHITSELEKLAMREKYNGYDQIHAATDQVCRLDILVILLYIPLVAILFLKIFFTFQRLPRTLYLFIN